MEDKEMMPLVSVIMPSYNHEKYIEEAIRSVWEQTYPNIELIVLDDGSKDKSSEIIKGLEKISPIRMKVVLKENEGLCRTLNKGLALAEGEYIGVLASDDRYLSNKIHDQVEAFQRLDESYAVVYSDGYYMNEDGTLLDKKLTEQLNLNEINHNDKDFFKIIQHQFLISPQTALFRKQAINNVEGFDESLSFEDLDLYLKLAKFYKFYFLDINVVCYRLIENGLRENLKVDEIMRIVFKHIDFLDKKEQKEVLRYRYMKFAERNLYLCNISKGMKYYFNLVRLKTYNLKYYKFLIRFLLRCLVIKIFGEKIITLKKHVRK